MSNSLRFFSMLMQMSTLHQQILMDGPLSEAAACSSNIELIQLLLNARADVNAPAAKYAAALFGHVRVATILLNAGADANAKEVLLNRRTALEGAAERRHMDMVQVLFNSAVTSAKRTVCNTKERFN
jgi:ankyrin repeat protein